HLIALLDRFPALLALPVERGLLQQLRRRHRGLLRRCWRRRRTRLRGLCLRPRGRGRSMNRRVRRPVLVYPAAASPTTEGGVPATPAPRLRTVWCVRPPDDEVVIIVVHLQLRCSQLRLQLMDLPVETVYERRIHNVEPGLANDITGALRRQLP